MSTTTETAARLSDRPATHASKPVRLSVNLAPDVARVLKELVDRKAINITEGIRRAIAVWNFVETERARGNRLAVIETHGDRERVREFVLVD